MMTQTHILVGAALFARPGAPGLAAAAIAGALLPDLDVAAMWLVERANGVSSCVIFRDRFWESPWIEAQAIVNSLPLWSALALVGFLFWGSRSVLFVFAATGALHIVGDFLLHADDARAHLHPFTDWRFFSPVSYWDPAKFGRLVSVVEAFAGLLLVAVLWRSFGGRRPRAALALAATLYAVGVGATFSASEADYGRQASCAEDAATV